MLVRCVALLLGVACVVACGANGQPLLAASDESASHIDAQQAPRLRVTYGLPVFNLSGRGAGVRFAGRDSSAAALFFVSGVRARVSAEDVELAHDVLLDHPLMPLGFTHCATVVLFGGSALYRSVGFTGRAEMLDNVRGVTEIEATDNIAIIRTEAGYYRLPCDPEAAAVPIVIGSVDMRAVEEVVADGEAWFARLSDGSMHRSSDQGATWSRLPAAANPIAEHRARQSPPREPLPHTSTELARLEDALALARVARPNVLRDGRTVAFVPIETGGAHALDVVIRTSGGQTRTARVAVEEGSAHAWTLNWGQRVVVVIQGGEATRRRHLELTRANTVADLPLGLSEHRGGMLFDAQGRFAVAYNDEARAERTPAYCRSDICIADLATGLLRGVTSPAGEHDLMAISSNGTLQSELRSGAGVSRWILPPGENEFRRAPAAFNDALDVTFTSDAVLLGREPIAPLSGPRTVSHPHLYRWDTQSTASDVQRLELPGNTRNIAFLTSMDGVAVGDSLADVFVTSDAGQSWRRTHVEIVGDPALVTFNRNEVACTWEECVIDDDLIVDLQSASSPVSQFLAAGEESAWVVFAAQADPHLALTPERGRLDCTFEPTRTVDSFTGADPVNRAGVDGMFLRETRGTSEARFVWIGMDDRGRFRVDTPWRPRSAVRATDLESLRNDCVAVLTTRRRIYFECSASTISVTDAGDIHTGQQRGTVVGEQYEARVGAMRLAYSSNDSMMHAPTVGFLEGRVSEFQLHWPLRVNQPSAYFVVAAPVGEPTEVGPTVFDWDGQIQHACDPALDPQHNSLRIFVERWLPTSILGGSSARVIPTEGTLCINRFEALDVNEGGRWYTRLYTQGNDTFLGTQMQLGFVSETRTLEVRERGLRCRIVMEQAQLP
jgi:hypothetical protein